MPEFEYGPVEILLISFEGDKPGPAIGAALQNLIEEKTITLLDLIFVSLSADGDPRIVEIDDLPDRSQLPDIEWANSAWPAWTTSKSSRRSSLRARRRRSSSWSSPGRGTSRLSLRRPAGPSSIRNGSPLRSSTRCSKQRAGDSSYPARTAPPNSKDPIMSPRRMGRPGLIGMAARTAVVAGTATAVSGNMQRRQQARAQDAQAQADAEAQAQQHYDYAQLAQLHSAGVLSASEFTAAKGKLLA